MRVEQWGHSIFSPDVLVLDTLGRRAISVVAKRGFSNLLAVITLGKIGALVLETLGRRAVSVVTKRGFSDVLVLIRLAEMGGDPKPKGCSQGSSNVLISLKVDCGNVSILS
jgi:ABC-type sulfate transport system substrate-binding protein